MNIYIGVFCIYTMAKRRKALTRIGHNVPANLKFALLVAVVIFWVDFIRSALDVALYEMFHTETQVYVNLLIALIMTVLAYLFLEAFTRIRNYLEKIKL